MGSPGIWGHVVLAEVRCGVCVVWGCGVAGAPLPTEIRLISQELPEDEDVHLLCCWDARGSMCMVTHLCSKHLQVVVYA